MDIDPLRTSTDQTGHQHPQVPDDIWAEALSAARSAALEMLGHLGKWAPIEPVVMALGDPDTSVRSRAVYACERLKEYAPVEALARALHDPDPKIRERVFSSLVHIGVAAPIEALAEALEDDDASVRRHKVWAVKYLGARAPIEPLVRALQDPDAEVREDAVKALAQVGARAPLEPLMQAFLGDPSRSVRTSALEALGCLDNRAPKELLIQMLESSLPGRHGESTPDIEMRISAIRALGYLGEQAPIDLLLTIWSGEREMGIVRAAVLEALTYAGDRAPIEPFIQTFTEYKFGDSTLQAAMSALPYQGERIPTEVLIEVVEKYGHQGRSLLHGTVVKLLAGRGEQVPADFWVDALHRAPGHLHPLVIHELEQLGKRAPIDKLVLALRDPDRTVRYQSAQTLGYLGERVPTQPLVDALADSDRAVRWYAAEALGRLHKTDAVQPLVEALGDTDPILRVKAAEALARLHEQEHAPIDILARELVEGDHGAPFYAALALENLCARAPIEPLAAVLGDDDSTLRWIAARALDDRAPEQLKRAAAEAIRVICVGAENIEELPVLGSLVQKCIIGIVRESANPTSFALNYLMYLLDWPDARAQALSIRALEKLGVNAPEAVLPRLHEVHSDAKRTGVVRETAGKVAANLPLAHIIVQLAQQANQATLESVVSLSPEDFARFLNLLFDWAGYSLEDDAVPHASKGVSVDLSLYEEGESHRLRALARAWQRKSDDLVDADALPAFADELGAHHESVSGFLITTSDFTSEAYRAAGKYGSRIKLLNGARLLGYIASVYEFHRQQQGDYDEEPAPLAPE